MQRNRDEDVRLVEQGAAAAVEPAGEGRREVEPVAMLEGEDRAAARFVVAHDGAGAVIAGGWAWQAAQSVSPPGSKSNGAPQAAHIGPSRKRTFCQHGAQSAPGSATWERQPMQSGG